MNTNEWKVAVGADEVSAAYDAPTSGEDVGTFLYAHGAGGSMLDRGLVASANAMRRHGIGVVRFNFIYREKKSSRPDAMPKCMNVISAIVARVREELSPARLFIGGRSFGGRAASMLAADGFDADGLVLLAYPLHPPGAPEKLRIAHLPAITMPVLAFSGTRDPFCTPVLMEEALKTVTAPWEMHWVEGAEHSFHVSKSSGTTDAEVMDAMAAQSSEWMAGVKQA